MRGVVGVLGGLFVELVLKAPAQTIIIACFDHLTANVLNTAIHETCSAPKHARSRSLVY